MVFQSVVKMQIFATGARRRSSLVTHHRTIATVPQSHRRRPVPEPMMYQPPPNYAIRCEPIEKKRLCLMPIVDALSVTSPADVSVASAVAVASVPSQRY